MRSEGSVLPYRALGCLWPTQPLKWIQSYVQSGLPAGLAAKCFPTRPCAWRHAAVLLFNGPKSATHNNSCGLQTRAKRQREAQRLCKGGYEEVEGKCVYVLRLRARQRGAQGGNTGAGVCLYKLHVQPPRWRWPRTEGQREDLASDPHHRPLTVRAGRCRRWHFRAWWWGGCAHAEERK